MQNAKLAIIDFELLLLQKYKWFDWINSHQDTKKKWGSGVMVGATSWSRERVRL